MIRTILEILVRAVATILFVAGFSAAIFVLEQAKDLYENPSSIEYFAEQIEVATNLDRRISQVLAGALSTRLDTTPKTDEDSDIIEDQATTANATGEGDAPMQGDATVQGDAPVRLSYFVAWLIVILLLSLLIRISLAMAHTGGILVLHDLKARPVNPDRQGNNHK